MKAKGGEAHHPHPAIRRAPTTRSLRSATSTTGVARQARSRARTRRLSATGAFVRYPPTSRRLAGRRGDMLKSGSRAWHPTGRVASSSQIPESKSRRNSHQRWLLLPPKQAPMLTPRSRAWHGDNGGPRGMLARLEDRNSQKSPRWLSCAEISQPLHPDAEPS